MSIVCVCVGARASHRASVCTRCARVCVCVCVCVLKYILTILVLVIRPTPSNSPSAPSLCSIAGLPPLFENSGSAPLT